MTVDSRTGTAATPPVLPGLIGVGITCPAMTTAALTVVSAGRHGVAGVVPIGFVPSRGHGEWGAR